MSFAHQVTDKGLVCQKYLFASRAILSLRLVNVIGLMVPAKQLSLGVFLLKHLREGSNKSYEIKQWSGSLDVLRKIVL
jgi:hypothetical protein